MWSFGWRIIGDGRRRETSRLRPALMHVEICVHCVRTGLCNTSRLGCEERLEVVSKRAIEKLQEESLPGRPQHSSRFNCVLRSV